MKIASHVIQPKLHILCIQNAIHRKLQIRYYICGKKKIACIFLTIDHGHNNVTLLDFLW